MSGNMTNEFWITRDKDGFLALWNANEDPPQRFEHSRSFIPDTEPCHWFIISRKLFPEVTWENSPRKIKIKLV